MNKVVVTGYGLVTPLGSDVASTWSRVKRSQSGIRRIDDQPEFASISSKIGGRIWGFDAHAHFSKKELRRYDPFVQYALVASREALRLAGIKKNDEKVDPHRVGVSIGSGIGGIKTIEDETKKLHLESASRISPFFIPSSLINMASGFVSLENGLKGPNLSIVSACASGAHNIMFGAQQIELGLADVMLCGGTEYATVGMGSGGFAAMRALSTNNDNPQQASRPWDRDRDGFVISDGAGVLILENEESAKKRGATIYAELTGYGMNADAYHMIQPAADGSGAARCMENALLKAKMNPEAISYINAHATSTPVGDQIEPLAIKRTFGTHAQHLAVSSTKSMHGHMLGAAGAAEAIITILSLNEQCVPATINCDNPSDGCDLDFVRGEMRQQKFQHAMSNSFGFGGTNASLIFSKYK